MSKSVNLNADLGEGFGLWPLGDDTAMLEVVNSANIACGFHAGDATVMTRTVRAALACGVAIGAHPSYPDLQGFGRRAMALTEAEIEAVVIYQIGALAGIAGAQGARVEHVKPHGALSNRAAVDAAAAAAIARAVKAVDAGLILLAPAGSAMVRAGLDLGLRVEEEVFADRAYADDGTLIPRSHPLAMIHRPDQAALHAVRMVGEGVIRTLSGKEIATTARSVCVHGDDPHAVDLARHVRTVLEAAHLTLAPLSQL
ncbi:putative lactam utilization protein, UPF0271 family [Candidatus Terasakiella magnetica]|nr:putative lactam utilization protein, UPF0271 family [Candidatus Terasakiella magnetica]